jgi:hypothetical protein
MRKRTKIICMALAAFFAFSALAASAQGADQWYKSTTQNGTFTVLGGANAIKGGSGASTLAVTALGFTIECKKSELTGSPVINNLSAAAVIKGTVTFTECQIKGVSTAVCQVKSVGKPNGTIATTALTGLTNTTTGANKGHVQFSPDSGIFTEIEILGGECAFLQTTPQKVEKAVEGVLSPAGNVAAQKATLEFPSTALAGSTITYGGNPAKFVSTQTAELVSGEWVMLK